MVGVLENLTPWARAFTNIGTPITKTAPAIITRWRKNDLDEFIFPKKPYLERFFGL